MKVMISYPPFRDKGSPMLTQNRQFQWYHAPSFIFPLVPAMAATLLHEKGFEVIWNDAITEGWSYGQFLDFFRSQKADIIAMESKTPVIKKHWKLVSELKAINPACKIALVGDHVTAEPEESMVSSRVDYVITGGNYDLSLVAIAENIRDGKALPAGVWYREDGGVKNTGEFSLDCDLNSLPFIDRELTKAHLYGEKWKKRLPFFYTMAGRDCPWGKCTFCSWTTLYPKFKVRSTENLLDELGFLIEKYGVREIFDDTGTFPGGKWLESFCEGMIRRGYNKKVLFSCNVRFDYLTVEMAKLMKAAGFRKVKAGLESANQSTLDRIAKGISVQQIIDGCRAASRAGIDVHLTVMIGYPWETKEDAQRTLKLARKLMGDGDAEMLQATIVIPYPGTPLYRYAVENDLFRIDPKDYDRFDMTEPVLKVPDMEPEEVVGMCRQVYQAFLRPKYILRRLLAVRSVSDLNYIFRGSKAVVGHIRDFLKIRRAD